MGSVRRKRLRSPGELAAIWREDAETTWTASEAGLIRWRHDPTTIEALFGPGTRTAAFADGQALVVEGGLSLWDLESRERIWQNQELRATFEIGAAFIDAERVLVAERSTLHVCDRATGRRLELKHTNPRYVRCVAAGGGRWAYGTLERVFVHGPSGVDEIAAYGAHNLGVSASGSRVAFADEREVHVYVAREGSPKMTRSAKHACSARGVGFVGETLFVATANGSVLRCEEDVFVAEGTLPADATNGRHVIFGPYGPVSSDDFLVDLFDRAFAKEGTLGLFGDTTVKPLVAGRALVVAVHADGQNSNYSAQIWDTTAMRPISLIIDRTSALELPAIDPSRTRIAFVDDDLALHVVDARTAKSVVELSLWSIDKDFWDGGVDYEVSFADTDHVVIGGESDQETSSRHRAWSVEVPSGKATLLDDPKGGTKRVARPRRRPRSRG